MSLSIEQLDLEPDVKAKAEELKRLHSQVVFLSGRRTLEQQAAAMASNIINGGRDWIRETYSPSAAITVLQEVIDRHPEARSAAALTAVLLHAMQQFIPAEQNSISRHLTGRAFDLQPGSCPISALEALYPRKLLTREGNLPRLHVEF